MTEALRKYAEEFAAEIKRYNEIVLREEAANELTLVDLSCALSRLLELGERCPDAYSENDVEAPEPNREAIKKLISMRFPEIGFYNFADPSREVIGDSKIYMGDAGDDLEEIHRDLNEGLWFMDRGDLENGLWHLKLHFGHWGSHAIDLKRYIHNRLHGF